MGVVKEINSFCVALLGGAGGELFTAESHREWRCIFTPCRSYSTTSTLCKSLCSALRQNPDWAAVQKNAEGVEVKIIVDQFLTDKLAVELLQKTGVDIKWDSTKLSTHNKLMIVDGKIVLIGSTNWSYYSFSKNHES